LGPHERHSPRQVGSTQRASPPHTAPRSTRLALPAAASADPYTAPGNKVLWGGQGGYTAGSIGAFTQQSGKHPAVFNPQVALLWVPLSYGNPEIPKNDPQHVWPGGA
jgi:hypothetical protein